MAACDIDVVVLGAGAVGSLVGGLLSRRARVALVCRGTHARAIRKDGLRITGLTRRTVRLPAYDGLDGLRPPSVLLVTTKSFDTRRALRDARALVGPETLVVLLQNGLGNEETAKGLVSPSRLIRGVSYAGVTFSDPGRIRWVGKGATFLGCPWGKLDAWRRARAGQLVSSLRAAGLDARVLGRVQRQVWSKTIVNVAVNPVGALTGMRNGELAEDPATRGLMASLAAEAGRVASAEGFVGPTMRKVLSVARATARNRNSMLQDLERGRRTEIDFLNGAIVRLGKTRGIATPCNACMWALVKTAEKRAGLQ